jgi:predicted metalloprotease with PDZ domain
MISFRKLWLVLFVSAVSSTGASSQTPLRLTYVFTPDLSNPSAPVLHVRLEFQGNKDGLSKLVLPTTWAGQRDLYKSVTNLNSFDSTARLTAGDSDEIRIVRYPPNHKVEMAYDLSNDWTGLLRHPKEFRVVVRSTDFIFNGQNGLVYPEMPQSTHVHATFKWRGLPQAWIAVSSFAICKASTSFHGQWHSVHDALFAVGDFRTTRLNSGGEKLTLAARGSWIFSDKQAAEEIMSLFRVERQFWGETKRDKFLVVLTSYDQDLGSSDGTAFTGSFLLYFSKKQMFLMDIKSQLAHEIFHTWNPYRMGQPSGEATEWFTEGFTQYYQDRILLKARLITFADYVDRLNQIVSAYWSSPDRNWPQQQWLDRKQTGNPEYQLPYKRGAVIALWLDETIRRDSGNKSSLDDRMLTLLGPKDSQLTTESLIAVLCDGLSNENREQLRSFVEDGETVPLPKELEPGCATLSTEEPLPRYKPNVTKSCEQQLASRNLR